MYCWIIFSIFRLVQPSPQSVLEYFYHSPKKPICIRTTPYCQPKSSTEILFALDLLFWTFYLSGIIQHMAFCVWLISFSTMFSRFFCVVALISILFKKILMSPWPVWLSWLGIIPQKERSLVWFPVRAHAWVVGSEPGQGTYKRQLMYVSLSCWRLSLSLSPYLPLSLKVNK